MDVVAALFHPLEPRLLMLCIDAAQADAMQRYLQNLSLPIKGLQPVQHPDFAYDNNRHRVILVESGRSAR